MTGRPAAPKPCPDRAHPRCTGGAARGSRVSPGRLREDLLVKRQVGDRVAQPLVLFPELIEGTQLIAADPAILLAPPVERDVANPELPDRLCHRHVLTVQNLRPACRSPPACNASSPLMVLPVHNFNMDQSNGGGSIITPPTAVVRCYLILVGG